MFKQDLLLLEFNKDVVCIMEQGYSHPDCKVVPSPSRRIEVDVESKVPTYDPYIPRQHALFYNCSALECKSIILYSLTEISNPNLNLRSCFQQGSGKFECEPIRYHYFKNIDKLLFLQSNLENKTFYLVDCFVFQDYSRVCHKKDVNSHADLVKLAAVAKPKEPNSLSQDEFLCEETDTNTDTKAITCDLDPYIPFKDGLKLKDTVKVEGTIVLKTGDYVVGLNRRCFDPWCGYTGQVLPDSVKIPTTKRNFRRFAKYEPPGGAVYRCYYAKRQQMCACGALGALDGYSRQQDPDQFHIQTDEDDERYFLYQTHNGQYRKERRLKDGSVVGSTGWVGADGYLRLQDYIADDQGYRIYKSKTVFVGQNRPIGESLQIAKTAPTDAGFGVTPAPSPAVQRARGHSRFTPTTSAPPPLSTLAAPHVFPSEVSITPQSYPRPTSTPHVVVSPNSIDSSTSYNYRPTARPITASESTDVTPSGRPYDYDSSNTNTLDDGYYASDSTPYRRYDVYNPNSYRHADAWLRRRGPGLRLGDGYTPQFPGYDGVAFRKNGFRYYLPKQYHEEISTDADERTGSFGYVDPFGIRRVIYYNTAPGGGFQIRKNNRYVGHDATPYDPRPVD